LILRNKTTFCRLLDDNQPFTAIKRLHIFQQPLIPGL